MTSTLPTPSTPEPRYTRPAVVLHWLLALGLFTAFSVGLYMSDLPVSPQRLKLYSYHKWAGITLLVLSLLRLAWRLTHRPPTDVAMPGWQRTSSHATHIALYVLFFAVPLVGWAYSSAAGFPVVLYGIWPLPDFVSPDKALAQQIKPWHGYLAFTMAGLVVLHVFAALKHQFVDRDGLIRRMSLRSQKATS